MLSPLLDGNGHGMMENGWRRKGQKEVWERHTRTVSNSFNTEMANKIKFALLSICNNELINVQVFARAWDKAVVAGRRRAEP